MAIYLTKDSKVLVQGMTGAEGIRKAGRTVDFGGRALPVFGAVREGVEATGADVAVVFVPPAFCKAAVAEAADAGISLAVVITEDIPAHDTVAFQAYAKQRGTRVIGPNRPGLIAPGQANAGIIPADITKPGRIGLVSKSGTLTYQLLRELRDIGFSACVGIGGDPAIGTTHIDSLWVFEDDPDTELVVLIGEIGGDAEKRAAAYIREHIGKPVIGYVAGFAAPEGRTFTAPEGRTMGTPERSFPVPPARPARRGRRWKRPECASAPPPPRRPASSSTAPAPLTARRETDGPCPRPAPATAPPPAAASPASPWLARSPPAKAPRNHPVTHRATPPHLRRCRKVGGWGRGRTGEIRR